MFSTKRLAGCSVPQELARRLGGRWLRLVCGGRVAPPLLRAGHGDPGHLDPWLALILLASRAQRPPNRETVGKSRVCQGLIGFGLMW